jgi:hypothetical protein
MSAGLKISCLVIIQNSDYPLRKLSSVSVHFWMFFHCGMSRTIGPQIVSTFEFVCT